MKNTLEQYVAQHNSWQKIFDKAHVDIDINNMSKLQADELIRKLDGEMSPENLHCDGEISLTEAEAKGNRLMHVVDDLEAYCTKNGFNMPTIYEAW